MSHRCRRVSRFVSHPGEAQCPICWPHVSARPCKLAMSDTMFGDRHTGEAGWQCIRIASGTLRATSAVVLPNVWRISSGRALRGRHYDLQLTVTKPSSIRSLMDRQLHAQGWASARDTSASGASCSQRTFHHEPAGTGIAGEGADSSRATRVQRTTAIRKRNSRVIAVAGAGRARIGPLSTMQVHGGGRRTWRGTRGAGGPRVPNGLPTQSNRPVLADAQKPALAGCP